MLGHALECLQLSLLLMIKKLMHESIIYSQKSVCVFAPKSMYNQVDLHGILTKPYVNLKALRTDCSLLLTQQTQTAATL